MPVLLADRFEGTSPLYWEDAEADRVQHLLQLLGVEGEVAQEYAGLGPDDVLIRIGDEDE